MRQVGEGGIIVPGCRLVEPGLYGPSWAKYLARPVGNGRGAVRGRESVQEAALRFRESRAIEQESPGAAAAEDKKKTVVCLRQNNRLSISNSVKI